MKKRMLAILLAIAMIAGVLPFAAVAAEPCLHKNYRVEEIYWEASCTAEGFMHIFCNDCETNQAVIIPCHKWRDGVCTDCRVPCGHEDYEVTNLIADATCEAGGKELRHCNICAYDFLYNTDPSDNHAWTDGACSVCKTRCEHADYEMTDLIADATCEAGGKELQRAAFPSFPR